ncbi:serine hydrolase domain-containing protein [Micromonospora aurantiaca (nom. illeg.)]|uniref:serine hydrolase domain-containing protein n=1 Tax=Micromonospora aurantiaca (nom. illeg.) TaxID=47850 RepID=UPI0036A32595
MHSDLVGHENSGTAWSRAAGERFAAVEEALRASVRAEGVPGASAAVLEGNQWLSASYGIDDLTTGRVRDESSRQHTSCMNKVLIAYVALMLVDRKLVALDEPLSTLLPEAVRRRDGRIVDITLRQLLSHTSGIDESIEEWAPDVAMDAALSVRRFENYSQLAEPGEIVAYSDAGTAIAALLIERLLGKPWRRAVNELLLGPLDIKPIPEVDDFEEYYEGAVAAGHRWDEPSGSFQPVPPEAPSALADSLGERSACLTLGEVATLAQFALDDGVTRDGRRLLSAELAREMRKRQAPFPRHHLIHSWGLGWLHFDEESFGFEASWLGHQSFVQIFPEERLALVVLVNTYPGLVVYYDVLRAVTGRGQPWQDRPAPPVDAELCVGTYSSDGDRLIITPGAKHLRYQFFERVSKDEWRHMESGDLVPSGTGGFAGRLGNRIRPGTISPIWSGDGPKPKFFRFGQRVVRRIS